MNGTKDILIIDDDKDLVHSIRIILERYHYGVRVAYNGKEGFEKIEAKPPDLVILDVMMATDTEGFDLAFKLKQSLKYRDIPVVLASSFPRAMAEKGTEKFQHIMGETWPVAHFLEKPIDPEDLLSVLEMILSEKEKA